MSRVKQLPTYLCRMLKHLEEYGGRQLNLTELEASVNLTKAVL